MRRAVVLLCLTALAGCASGPPPPAAFTPGAVVCGHCKMVIVDQSLAAQIVADGAAPMFFNDIGCMIEHLSRDTRIRPGEIAYVADHLTGEWVRAVDALYTRNLRVTTPMGSHLIAHANAANQAEDPAARTGARVTVRDLLPLDIPDGTR